MKKLFLIFLLLPILGFTQGFQTKTDTIHFLNQNKVIALQDSLNKKIAWTDTGTTANKIIKLDGAAKLPAVDGSQLTGISAGATILSKVKTANEIVNNSATLQNDDHLFFNVATNSTYIIEVVLFGGSTSITPQLKVGFTAPTGATMLGGIFNTTTANNVFAALYSLDMLIAGGWTNAAWEYAHAYANLYIIRGVLTTIGTAGTLQLQWAQTNATVTDTNVRISSYIKGIKVQ